MLRFFDLKNKWFIWPLFLFLMIYAILRAVLVQPMLDELGTFYWYIETGLFPGHGAPMDPNNHILNSFISNLFYRAFGDHFFLFRIFALSTFPIYFYACRRFVLKINPSFSVLIFLGLISTHWIFDYFSLTRGYGPTLAFLMLAFCFILEWNKTLKTKHFVFTIICLALLVLSNLSLLIPVVLLFAYLLLVFILRMKELSGSQRILFLFSALIFLAFLVPVYIYVQKLKKAGTLWWGSTDGLWEVTGKSLSENIFFTDHQSIKYLLIVMLVLIVVISIIQWKKTGFRQFLFEPEFWIPGLFILCLISFIAMATLMHVNYPMDRVGMYLVPLFILTLGIVLSSQKQLKWILVLLLWFPVSFVWKANLNTTIFSPADRIQPAMYSRIKEELKPGDVLSADYVASAIYAYNERGMKTPHLAVELTQDSLTRGDYHISWIDQLYWPNYECIYREPVSGTRLYKRINTPARYLVLDTVITLSPSNELYVPVLTFDLKKHPEIKFIQTWISGNVSLNKPFLHLNLIHAISKIDGTNRALQATRANGYFGEKTHYSFSLPNQSFRLEPDDSELALFFSNPEMRKVGLNNFRIRIYALKTKQ